VFFTPTDAQGVTIHDDWSGFGQRTTASGTTEFDNVWIPDELCLGSPDTEGGGGGAVTSLNYQAVHTGVFVGIARNALDDAVEFVRTRARLWYESPAERATDDLYIQLRVGEMKTAVDAAELLSLRAAELCDEAVAHPGDERIRGEASVVTGRPRRRCSPGRRCSRCAAQAASWRSTASTGTGATPAPCPCTTRSTSSPCTPATSC
jgi:alkylation response protein AidB-like acyl-CoA dehydrogenase